MNRLLTLALLALLVGATAAPASAADVTEAELMQAATALAQQYDANYAAKNPAGMAALYASDGVLVAPSGSIVRGRQALTTYYANRFGSGARGHAIKVVEAHVQGNGGYGLTQFTVTVPGGMAIFARSTAASSWSIDATPMDGTCASSNRACRSRPTNRRQ